MNQQLYSSTIVNLSKNPKNYVGKNRSIIDLTWFSSVGKFPSCSETLTIFIKHEDEKIIDIRWDGSGSSVLFASASILTDMVKGYTFDETIILVDKIFECFSQTREFNRTEIGDIIYLESVKNFPRRVRSAILPAHTIKLTINKIRNKQNVR